MKYVPTIGMEVHVQLKTKTKLFSAISNDAREAEPNVLVSPICFGLPGVLPVLNEEAIELAIRAGLALSAEIARFSTFDRKHYFYPDLPKGYQITQYDQPLVGKGSVEVPVDGEKVKVGITRAHLEEDAGKSIHPAGADYSLVDLNRAGTPLLEIVSEPDMHSAKEARAFAQELYFLMKFADVSDVDLYHGNMRFDVNVSLAPEGADKLGVRSETKNLNSFRAVERAVEYEIKRQRELLEAGKSVVQETRGWDEAKQKTVAQRGKEEAHDYRYFPEPDLPPVTIDEQQIEKVRGQLPLLPEVLRERLGALQLDHRQINTLLEADGTDGVNYTQTLLTLIDADKLEVAGFVANWLLNVEVALRAQGQSGSLPSIEQFETVHQLIKDKRLNSTNAKKLLEELLKGDANVDARQLAEEKGLLQEADEDAVAKLVDEVIAENQKAAEDVRSGELKAIGFLVGQVMKQSRGQVDPETAQALIKRRLTSDES